MGQEINEHEAEKKYGSGFYDTFSKDLKKALPGIKSFVSTNFRYMAKFYALYTDENFLQVVGESEKEKLPQVVGELQDKFFSVTWGTQRTESSLVYDGRSFTD